ncbi:MAG TPA: hypothetical protein VHS06_08050 [Chloroflexota bacterium]|nr:hypothetical protein [Chloroflexota bacterium]
MEDKATIEDEVLILGDQEGNLYVIPREVVESYRASAEQKAEIRELLEEEVTGFQMPSDFLLHSLVEQHEAQRLEEASHERMARTALMEEEEKEEPPGGTKVGHPPVTGVGHPLTGLWRRLHLVQHAKPAR